MSMLCCGEYVLVYVSLSYLYCCSLIVKSLVQEFLGVLYILCICIFIVIVSEI